MRGLTLFVAVSVIASAYAKQCVNITIPVTINARQGQFNVPTLMSNLDVTTFVQNYTLSTMLLSRETTTLVQHSASPMMLLQLILLSKS